MKITGKGFCHISLRDSSCQNRRKDWNTGTWGRWRTMCGVWLRNGWNMGTGAGADGEGTIGEDSGKKMQWETVWGDRTSSETDIWRGKSRRAIWRDPDGGEVTKERRKGISISSNRACGWIGRKDTGRKKTIAAHGWILEMSTETVLFQQKDKSKRKLPTITWQ